MRYIIYSTLYPSKKHDKRDGSFCHTDKIAAIHRAIDVICLLEDVNEMKKLLAGLWAFNDKMISRKDSEEIRRLLNMTKIEQIIYKMIKITHHL